MSWVIKRELKLRAIIGCLIELKFNRLWRFSPDFLQSYHFFSISKLCGSFGRGVPKNAQGATCPYIDRPLATP